MNLKNTIDNTNKCTNDLKLARQKINDRIISGGGSIANTISAVPKAIDTMLKENYKKIATINLNKNIGINIDPGQLMDVSVDISLNFNPSIVILVFNNSTNIIYPLNNNNSNKVTTESYVGYIVSVSNKNIKFKYGRQSKYITSTILQTIIAIE